MADQSAIRPIITLTTDFGTSDWYVAAMKAVLLTHCPTANLIDITHQLPPGEILPASIVLERAVAAFTQPAIHLAVIDPGVGTNRRLLLATTASAKIICPDNGLITWTARRHPNLTFNEITWRPAHASNTFHGRDILAPIASMLAAGKPANAFQGPLIAPILLPIAPITDLSQPAQIIHIDHFGNATTNVPADLLAANPNAQIFLETHSVGPVRKTYAEADPGELLALIGSSDLLEIATRLPSKTNHNVKINDPVFIR